jgi:arylsulfatase A
MFAALAALAFVAPSKPNVILILCDDLGYGDVGCYGAKGYATPNIDRLAATGVRFANYYSGAPACSPARAALLTGCYPQRVGIPRVLNPDSKVALNRSEETLAEVLKAGGYRTAIVGKWHLGSTPGYFPTSHGFDSFFGLPYSNDMWPPNGKGWPDLWLMRGEERVDRVDSMDQQSSLTQRYTDEAIRFIRASDRRPFFLYLAHSMPHVPIGAAQKFRGKAATPFGDTVLDIDDSVGRIDKEVKRLGIDRNTIMIFTSDNGPWRPYGDHAGSSGGLRGHKGTCFEGGVRVPFIVCWPGRAEPRVERGLAAAMDLLPTLADLTSSRRQTKQKIDGLSLAGSLMKAEASPRSEFAYYYPDQLKAIRIGPWKLQVPHNDLVLDGPGGKDGKRVPERSERVGLALYNLETDPAESRDVASRHPEVVERLLLRIQKVRGELGDAIQRVQGREIRAPAKL